MAMKWRTMLTVLASFFPLIVIGDSLKEVQFSKKITSGIQNDLFGASVAVNEDIFVVGAPSDYRHYGSISIYNVKSNRSDAVAKIRSPGGMLFGGCVDLNKDLIVTATQGPSYVYVYSTKPPYTRYKSRWTAGYWTETSSITINDNNTIVVTGFIGVGDDHGSIVYIYKQTGPSTWKEETHMKFFGGSDIGEHPAVSLHGNILAAGIPGSDSETRRVHVYTHTGSGWKQTDSLSAQQDVWYYGNSIKLQQNRLAVSARSEDGTRDMIFVYSLDASSGKWIKDGGVIFPLGAPSANSELPAGVSICNDVVFVSVSDRESHPDVVAVGYTKVVQETGNVMWMEHIALTTHNDPLLNDQYNVIVGCHGNTVLVTRISRHDIGAVYKFDISPN